MHKDLQNALDFFKVTREELIQSYANKDSDRYHYSFKYMNCPASMDIASLLVSHLWVDAQIDKAKLLLDSSQISDESFSLILKTLQSLSLFRIRNDILGYSELLSTKIHAFETMLSYSDKQNRIVRQLEFDMERDRVLFEREMSKHSD